MVYKAPEIKKSREGTFTAWAKRNGFKSTQEAARHVLAHKERYSPEIVRKANFARNASTWNHKK